MVTRVRFARRWVVASALLVALLAGIAIWRVTALTDSAHEARDHLRAAAEALQQRSDDGGSTSASMGGIASACGDMVRADAALQRVAGELQLVQPLVQVLDPLPAVGSQARAQAAALDVGGQLAAAGATLCEGMEPFSSLLQPSTGSPDTRSTADVLKAMASSRPALLQASNQLHRLQESLNRLLSTETDDATRQAALSLQPRLPALLESLDEATAVLGLLGDSQPHHFLLVSQNADELRPSGGYIGSAGVIEVRDGTVHLVSYGSSRAFDTPPDWRVVPPAPFQRFLGSGYWNLAAANWWPSFPDDARQMEYFYRLARPGQPVEGVIALDQVGMARLLEATGPVAVPDYGETVSAATVQQALDRHVHGTAAPDGEADRKQFTAALSEAVIQRVLDGPSSQVPGLVRAVRAALDEQHLLVFADDPALGRLLAKKRWDGRLLTFDRDFLMLADTEVSSSKDSQQVTRDVAYAVTLAPAGPEAHLSLTYTSHSDRAVRAGVAAAPVYRTFLRVYAPPGASLVDGSHFGGPVDVTQGCGRTVFGGEVAVPRGEVTRVELTYTLPPSVMAAHGYDLVVQQQPNAPAGQVVVRVTDGEGVAAGAKLDSASTRWRRLQLAPSGDSRLLDAPVPDSEMQSPCSAVVEGSVLAAPQRIDIPTLAVSARIVELGVGSDGVMEAPETGDVVGWYRETARPGQPGNQVMAGHVDWSGKPAVFWGLRSLRVGQSIVVRDASGASHEYVVERNQSFRADTAPVDEIVGGTRDAVLTLITCDGPFDRQARDYTERRIVRARLIERAQRPPEATYP